jgi:ribose transport system substrate-binding protein
MNRKTLAGAIAALSVMALAACSTGASSGGTASPAASPSSAAAASFLNQKITSTVGPNGEKPTPAADISLTPADITKLRAGHYTAALLWHQSSAFVTAVQNGADTEFQRLGIRVTVTAQANMDAGTQANQVRTALATKPSAILSLPVDPVSAAQAFNPAVQQGVKLVFLSNAPKGYTYGKQYSSIVTDDLYQMGKRAAEALGNALGGKGTVGMIYYNTQYYVTNERDAAFKTTLESEFPGIKLVAEQGFTDPTATAGIASAMLTQHPNLDGLYVSYSEPAAEGVLSALRSVNDTHTKLVTLDLDNPVVVDMATGGNAMAVVADQAWNLGKGMADAAGLALLGQKAPAFAVAGALTITKADIAQGYQQSLHAGVPSTVAQALR